MRERQEKARNGEQVNDSTGEWLSKAIGQATRSAKFCVVGRLPVVDPGIEVDGLGAVQLPLKPKSAKEARPSL